MNSENNDFEFDNLVDEISKYNTKDFILSVSALMLFPRNQSKTVIFQTMINAALSLPDKTATLTNKMSMTTFKRIVKEFENSSVSSLVDPPEFPFVLPVLYFKNPYVFMGNNTLSPIYLNILLKIFEQRKHELDHSKYICLKNKIQGLLFFSNDIFDMLDIKLKDLSSYPTEEEIFIPDKKTLDFYKDKLCISCEKMSSIFGEEISNYSIEFESINRHDIIETEDPKYIFKPFVKVNDNYVILDVTCILPLLFRIIINEMCSVDNIDILSEYNKLCSAMLAKRFIIMGCHELCPTNINLVKEKKYEERLFLIENNCVIISIQLFDVSDYFNSDASDIEFDREYDYISKRISYLSNFLISSGIDSNNILVVLSPYTFGGNAIISFEKSDVDNLLILSLYELYAISINEEKNPFFLKEYIDARKRLKEYQKIMVSELNVISLFVSKEYSFYVSDEFDIKDTLMVIIGEYSSDYILKSYINESQILCRYLNDNSFVEVYKINESIYISPLLLQEGTLNKVVLDNNSTIWIVNKNNNYNIFQWLSDLISYWLVELFPLKDEKYNLIIELDIDDKLKYGVVQKDIIGDVDSIIHYEIKGNVLKICVTEELCNYFVCETNINEKEFMTYIIKILNDNWGLYYDKEKIEKTFHNPYKRKTIGINSVYDSNMMPSREKINMISKIYLGMLLDDIGIYLKARYDYGVINDKKVLENVVDYLYNRLVGDLKKYNKVDLIFYLYEIYDRNLGNLLIFQSNYANEISCYPDRKYDIDDELNEMNKLSVALRFMVELVSSFNKCGDKKISFSNLNMDIAISSQIIEWAYANDLLYYDMINSNVNLLKSNRIGFDKTSINNINVIMKKALVEKNSSESIEKSKLLGLFMPKLDEKDEKFDEAFHAEFGYTFSDYTEVVVTILELFHDNYDNLLEFKPIDVELNVRKNIPSDVITKILDSISLSARDDFLVPPEPYLPEDVYPWRFNRQLSLARRPIIKYEDNYIVGYRALINSVSYLINIINEGRLHAHSKIMKDYESRRNRIRGKSFNDHVFNYLSSIDSLIVKKNVKKINKKYISDEKNNPLGDIDIIYISPKRKIIGIVETKNMNVSKNYYEIKKEYESMFEPSNPKSYYSKHKRRVEWIKCHLSDLVEEFQLKNSKWKIKEMFVVEDYLISKKAFKVKANICTLGDLTTRELF